MIRWTFSREHTLISIVNRFLTTTNGPSSLFCTFQTPIIFYSQRYRLSLIWSELLTIGYLWDTYSEMTSFPIYQTCISTRSRCFIFGIPTTLYCLGLMVSVWLFKFQIGVSGFQLWNTVVVMHVCIYSLVVFCTTTRKSTKQYLFVCTKLSTVLVFSIN